MLKGGGVKTCIDWKVKHGGIAFSISFNIYIYIFIYIYIYIYI